MPENSAVDDRLIACEPIYIGSKQIGPQQSSLKTGGQFIDAVSLIPIVRQKLRSHTFTTQTWIAASKEPVALIVRDRNGIRIVQFEAALSIKQLRAQIPELDDLIAQY